MSIMNLIASGLGLGAPAAADIPQRPEPAPALVAQAEPTKTPEQLRSNGEALATKPTEANTQGGGRLTPADIKAIEDLVRKTVRETLVLGGKETPKEDKPATTPQVQPVAVPTTAGTETANKAAAEASPDIGELLKLFGGAAKAAENPTAKSDAGELPPALLEGLFKALAGPEKKPAA